MEETASESGSDDGGVQILLREKQVWERAAETLLRQSMATVELPSDLHEISATAFGRMRDVLLIMDDEDQTTPDISLLDTTADSAHATGFHRVGGLSARYNQYRRGFVFSDGQLCKVPGLPEFEVAMQRLFDLLHTILQRVLTALEQRLQLPPDWFQQQLGPTANHSQWHIKEYAPRDDNTQSRIKDDLWLATHSDPSLVSVVLHDRPGIQNGGQGLQVASKEESTGATVWTQVPVTGHGAAVILVGSAMATLTGGKIAACRHRVVATPEQGGSTTTRMAATLFGRPSPAALMVRPPCPYWTDDTPSMGTPTTFAAWNARVARNYEKSKRKSR
jgi:isopenicillin N synthase-like dioxygenase